MADDLVVSIGQHSDRGRKDINQDFHGACVPAPPQRRAKGIAAALADGISSSNVSQIASETAVKSFLDDYYATSDAWSVRKAAECVIAATNAWLYAQTRQGQHRHDRDQGFVCTFSAIVVKASTAYLFHVGDARILRIRGADVEQLTDDHRIQVSAQQAYLARALGIGTHVEIDHVSVPVEVGDTFLVICDGVHEFVDPQFMVDAVAARRNDLDRVARTIVDEALQRGSHDNVTAVLVAIDALPSPSASIWRDELAALPPAGLLDEEQKLDGYEIVRELQGSSRSHVYLARETATGERVVLKTPSIDRQAPAHLERFLLQEWIARRIVDVHVAKARPTSAGRTALYVVSEFVDGPTLAQWMIDHPRPTLDAVRDIVGQIASGLRAFHRLEMLHQDLRPANIMIDGHGTVKIIDFGSARVAGLDETGILDDGEMPGTFQYAAPEYFLGESGSVRSDVFSLGVIAYQMLCGKLPYGAEVPKARDRKALKRLRYRSARDDARAIPAWIDGALRKAVDPDPIKRYADPAEFVYDLRHPNAALAARPVPLLERDPLLFWKLLSTALGLATLALTYALSRH